MCTVIHWFFGIKNKEIQIDEALKYSKIKPNQRRRFGLIIESLIVVLVANDRLRDSTHGVLDGANLHSSFSFLYFFHDDQ